MVEIGGHPPGCAGIALGMFVARTFMRLVLLSAFVEVWCYITGKSTYRLPTVSRKQPFSIPLQGRQIHDDHTLQVQHHAHLLLQ